VSSWQYWQGRRAFRCRRRARLSTPNARPSEAVGRVVLMGDNTHVSVSAAGICQTCCVMCGGLDSRAASAPILLRVVVCGSGERLPVRNIDL
jgi:hypothetical protein